MLLRRSRCLRVLKLLRRLRSIDVGHEIGILRLLVGVHNRQWCLCLSPRVLRGLVMTEVGYLLSLLARIARVRELLRLLLRLEALHLSLRLLRSILVLLCRVLSQGLLCILLLRSGTLDLVW